METGRSQRAAEILWSAWREQRLLEPLPAACRPESVADGYAIQEAMAALAGETRGWKVAATSTAGQRHINVTEPLAGRLFADFFLEEGAGVAAQPLHMAVAEAEFAFRIATDLPPRGEDYATLQVLSAVGALHLAIEVPDSRFRDFESVGAPQLVADDACAGWFILGPEVPGWTAADLATHPVQALLNGTTAARGSGAEVLGDPRRALVWLANDRARHGEGLKAGEIVTTGTCVKPVPIRPGDAFTADFGRLGSVSVQFT